MVRNDNLVSHPQARRDLVDPRWPGLDRETLDSRRAIRMDDAGNVPLTGNRCAAAVVLNPRIEAIDEHHPSRGRRRRREQEGVIAARANAAGGAGPEAPEAVSL